MQVQAFQLAQARCVGAGQAQSLGWVLIALIELAQGGQYGLESGKRQHHLQRAAIRGAGGVQLQAQLVIVLAPLEVLRVE
ncbi:hypothetical protein D3C76_1796320 [compost metagenome]